MPLSDSLRPLFDVSARERLASAATVPAASSQGSRRANGPYAQALVAFVKNGGRLLLGSDAGGGGTRIPGLADHEALENLVRLGFRPLDAIRIATLEDATFLGIQKRTGTIQAGKEADLLIVRGNPAEHIEDIEHVEMVFNNGLAYDPKTLLAPVRGQLGWK